MGKKEVNYDSLSIFLEKLELKSLTISQRIKFNQKALSLLLKRNNDSLTRQGLNKIAENYYSLNKWKELKYVSKILLFKSLEIQDYVNIANSYRNFGVYYENISVNDSAFYYYLKAEKIFKKSNNQVSLCTIFQDKAQVQYYVNDYLGSDESLIKALVIAKKLQLKEDQFKIYSFLGANSNEVGEYDKAFKYHYKALEIIKNNTINDRKVYIINCMNYIGYNFFMSGDISQAIKVYSNALKIDKIEDYPFMHSKLLDNYGYAKSKIYDFTLLPNLYFQAKRIRDSLNIDQGQNFNRLYLSEYYAAIKDTVNARLHAKEAYNLSKSFRAPNDMLICLKHLSRIDPSNELGYAAEYIKISDSMHQLERETRNKFAKIAYETEEITLEKDQAVKQKTIYLGIAITVTAFGLLLFIIINQKNKQKELLYAQNQQSAKEEIYQLIQTQQSKIDEGRQIEKKRIARDLHDGIMNKLTSTRFNLHILNNKTDEQTVKKCLPFIEGIQDIEKEIRNIAHNLNKEVFSESDSYKRILMTFFEEQKNILKARLHLDIDKSIHWELVESSIKINLYRILQEAMRNIGKHANADNVFISITGQKDYLVLEVHDDGFGFNPNDKDKGIGLQNIRERAKDCKAIFHVDSHQGNGTTIIVSVPFKNKDNA